jgi:hypothetical protein
MKKIILSFVALFMIVPSVSAATIYSENTTSMYKSDTKELWPVTIIAEKNNEITAANGINLMFESPAIQLLWDAVPTLSASGTAVTNGRVSAAPTVQYLNRYSVLHIPVLTDFVAGETAIFTGIRVRSYHTPYGSQFLRLDVTGDYVADAIDVNRIEVYDVFATDNTPPYPPTDVTIALSSDLKNVALSWKAPPDFDLAGMVLDRKRVRNGMTQDLNVLNFSPLTSYTDTDIQEGDVLTYRLYATDTQHFSEAFVKTIEVKASTAPSTPPSNPPAVEPPAPIINATDEQKQLSSLFGYYKTRQAIKCREGISPTDSACLWAKIDVVYAQALLNRSDVNISLSARDLELIALRIVWPEKRYKTECTDATTPAKSCPALGKSIRRAHYFIDTK